MKILENKMKNTLNLLWILTFGLVLSSSCNKDQDTLDIEYRVQCGFCRSSLLNEVGGLIEANVEGSYSFTRKHTIGEAAQLIVDRTTDSLTIYTQIVKGGQVMASDSAPFPDIESKLVWLVK